MTEPTINQDEYLVNKFGAKILELSDKERQELYTFCTTISWLAENKMHLEFNQP